MKGLSRHYKDISLETVMNMFKRFGDIVECDADMQIATDIINTDI